MFFADYTEDANSFCCCDTCNSFCVFLTHSEGFKDFAGIFSYDDILEQAPEAEIKHLQGYNFAHAF